MPLMLDSPWLPRSLLKWPFHPSFSSVKPQFWELWFDFLRKYSRKACFMQTSSTDEDIMQAILLSLQLRDQLAVNTTAPSTAEQEQDMVHSNPLLLKKWPRHLHHLVVHLLLIRSVLITTGWDSHYAVDARLRCITEDGFVSQRSSLVTLMESKAPCLWCLSYLVSKTGHTSCSDLAASCARPSK